MQNEYHRKIAIASSACKNPSLQIPPVEAGIRAGETRNLAFPYS